LILAGQQQNGTKKTNEETYSLIGFGLCTGARWRG
jgi:hypothetical protein